MGCKKLPYYQKYLRRGKSFPNLKVIYKRRLGENFRYTDKYQWDYIHDPETMLFSVLEDEGEGEVRASMVIEILTAIKKSLTNNEPIEFSSGKDVVNTAQNIYFPAEINTIATKSLKTISSINVTAEQIEKSSHQLSTDNYYDILVGELFRVTFSVEKDRNLVYNWLLKTGDVMVFVNGYRTKASLKTENDNTDNSIITSDRYDYWEGIDRLFATRRNISNVFYADGHMSITTSNHRDLNNFLSSFGSSVSAQIPDISQVEYGDITYTPGCYHNNSCVHLNTTPNVEGFELRKSNGRLAGQNLVVQLSKTGFNVETDKLDIVCHSMGFAYSLGMIEAIKEQLPSIKLGGYYIIAPENAGRGSVSVSEWDDIWQYGFDESKTDEMWLQDGIAPQCAIQNISGKRASIPDDVPHGFMKSHQIKYYTWIFNIRKDLDGYVTPKN